PAREDVVAGAGHGGRGVVIEAVLEVEYARRSGQEGPTRRRATGIQLDIPREDFEVCRAGEVEGHAEQGAARIARGLADGAVDSDGGSGAAGVEEALIVGKPTILIEQQCAAGRNMENRASDEGHRVGLAGQGRCASRQIESALDKTMAAAVG